MDKPKYPRKSNKPSPDKKDRPYKSTKRDGPSSHSVENKKTWPKKEGSGGRDHRDKGSRPTTERGRPQARDNWIDPAIAKDLDREWIIELRSTSRPGKSESAASLVVSALEAYSKGDYVRSATLAMQAKDFVTRSPRIRELAGLSFYQSGEWKSAVRELLTYRRLSGAVDQNHVIADCYRGLARPDRAIEICSEVTKSQVDPEIWSEVLIVSASAHAELGEVEKGIAQTSRGELNPKEVEEHHLRLWYTRADLLEGAGRKAEALKLWTRIADEHPEFFDVKERLRR